jgi:N6-adenosine-specific RNA methylase IME4
MQKHKFNIFPEMQEEDFELLKGDIKANGFDESMPIHIYEGEILDGWNRFRACKELGVTPTKQTFTGTDEEALDFVMRTNKRRNLNKSQWGCIAAESESLIEAIREKVETERRKKMADAKIGNNNASKEKQKVQLIEPVDSKDNSRLTSQKVATAHNTNRTYVSEAKRLKAEQPEKFEQVKRGEKTITEVKREIKEIKREERREENRAKVAEAPKAENLVKSGAKFSTIVMDPPWDWGDEGDNDQLGRSRPDYATMSFDQLSALPVNSLSDADCHLYMWITNRSLPKGFRLMEAWGFRYITALTWVKPSFGMGNYFRGQTEHILFGVKGSQQLKRKDVGTAFNAPRGPKGHSSKPVELYSLVESCSHGPYLEMFSRSNRPDWTTWGEGQ